MKPTRIEISPRPNGEFWIVAYYPTGSNSVFGNVRTLLGAKCKLTTHAKWAGLVKSKDGMSAVTQGAN